MWHVIDVGRLVYIRYAADPAADSAGARDVRAVLARPPPAAAPSPAPFSRGLFGFKRSFNYFFPPVICKAGEEKAMELVKEDDAA